MKIRHPFLLACAVSFTIGGCATPGGSPTPASAEAPSATLPSALARSAAALRSKQVSRVSMTMAFTLDEVREDFEGRETLAFDLKAGAPGPDLLIDFEEGAIQELAVNGRKLETPAARFDGHHVRIPLSELQAGAANRIELAFTHPYSHNGRGLHRFKDPIDGQVYLYSDFEPYDAHRMFPCFDQPDLKATYELAVDAPAAWTVIANTRETSSTKTANRRRWAFPRSAAFSTYIFALHAGDYQVWKGDAAGIPMRLFARRSLAKHVNHAEWLDITRRGLAYFSRYFGTDYPFGKYDQVIVPDFNAGAMENVAAVSFSERYVHRDRPTVDQRRRTADVILHEMAHMWFGDLVTMKWWNGLWLNESFATFMAHKAVDEATTFKASWQGFFGGSKQWAYWEDQLVTTHPIEVPVADTDQAGSNFDGITYGKGAAVLKQLNFLLGEANFQEGLNRYFERFAYKNTTLGDFIQSLAEAAERDLAGWQKSWLQTPGVNSLRAEWKCEGGKVSAFELVQSGAPLRAHRTQVALYALKAGRLALTQALPVAYANERTPLPEAIGQGCPAFVYPNHGDYDYARVELDPVSLAAAPHALANPPGTAPAEAAFFRQMIWHTLWEMTSHAQLKAQEYAELVLQHLPRETDSQTLQNVLGTVARAGGMETVLRFLAGEERTELAARIEKFTLAGLRKAAPGSDNQVLWFRAALAAAHAPETLRAARGWLAGQGLPPGLKIEQDRRWETIKALAREGAPEAETLVAAELKRDPTDAGEKAAVAAQALSPAPAAKAAWLERITRQELPYPKLREAMTHYYALEQLEAARPAIDAYFAMIPRLAGLKDEEYSRRFASAMFPQFCEPLVIQRATAALDAQPPLPASVAKSIRVGRQSEERCLKARELSASPRPLSQRGN